MFSGKDFSLHLVSFYGVIDGSESFHSAEQLKDRQNILNQTAIEFGDVDKTHSWDLTRLQATKYYQSNEELLSSPRGCGVLGMEAIYYYGNHEINKSRRLCIVLRYW